MVIIYSKKFKKQFKKLRAGEKKKFEERADIFIKSIANPQLNDHALSGNLSKYRSFNVTGDLRVLYERVEDHTIIFADIDTHSNLYS
ncbi:MAG TPA: type II toxin-antitoxin system mRNA interferase toxin, RelE/StbE family [Candidatus Yonathbacteria bacterium]|nr:type II toxin-antitoxin system mRNA interferase toxin, RelE/StbE family [Candidatus Yonathbacteria bacterium]